MSSAFPTRPGPAGSDQQAEIDRLVGLGGRVELAVPPIIPFCVLRFR